MATVYKDKKARGSHQRGRLSLLQCLSPPVLVLLTYSLFFAAIYQYLKFHSSRDPTSYFFDSKHAYQKLYSAQRSTEAEKFLRNAVAAPGLGQSREIAPKVCVGVATVARRGDQYVDLTIGSLLDGLSSAQRSELFLDILIGHTDPAQHPSFAHKWLDVLPDRILYYRDDAATTAQIHAWEEGGWYRNKSIYDYTYLLNDCYNTGAEYVVMLEDDTVAARNWYSRTLQALHDIEERTRNDLRGPKWIYLRLFYSDDLQGWNSEEWPRYLAWSSLIWTLCTITLLACRSRLKRGPERFSLPLVVVVVSVCIPATIALYFLAGKQTVAPLRAGVQLMNRFGCCSQGLVFPRSMIPDLIANTDLTTDWLVDMMVEKIADAEGWDRWAIVPPVLQHIGATSSKGYGFDDNAKQLWNFGFERGPV